MSSDKYIVDDDGLPTEIVGNWAQDKIAKLRYYIEATQAVRSGYKGSAYVELFSGPGRYRVRGDQTSYDGTSLSAWKASRKGKGPFSQVIVADLKSDLVSACQRRLIGEGATVRKLHGPAELTVDQAIALLQRDQLHLAFLDPYGLSPLSFEILAKLCTFPRMDILVHFSVSDFQRNFDLYSNAPESPLDTCAPGWRSVLGDRPRNTFANRMTYFRYWKEKVATLGKKVSESIALVSGDRNQPLYYLILISGHGTADRIWGDAYDQGGAPQLF